MLLVCIRMPQVINIARKSWLFHRGILSSPSCLLLKITSCKTAPPKMFFTFWRRYRSNRCWQESLKTTKAALRTAKTSYHSSLFHEHLQLQPGWRLCSCPINKRASESLFTVRGVSWGPVADEVPQVLRNSNNRCKIAIADSKIGMTIECDVLKILTFTNLSEGAKQPTHREMRIQPRAWELLDGFWVSCLQIWQ